MPETQVPACPDGCAGEVVAMRDGFTRAEPCGQVGGDGGREGTACPVQVAAGYLVEMKVIRPCISS